MATIAVVIPVYATPENHRLDFLGQTLRSVQQQTHRDLVYLVVDDGSSADVEGFFTEYCDNRGRYIRRERKPADLRTSSNALNLGISLCLKRSPDILTRAEADDLVAVAYLHSDDMLPSGSLQRRLEVLSTTAAFVYTDTFSLYVKSGVITTRRSNESFANSAQTAVGISHHTTMWTLKFAGMFADYATRVYGQDGIFDHRLFHSEDFDATLSGIEAAKIEKMPVVYAPFASYLYVVHEQSVSGELIQRNLLGQQDGLIYSKHFGFDEAG